MMCQLTLSHAQDFANNPVELSGMTNLYGDVKWADFDGDKDPDAIIAGYFTGVKVFPNNNGQLATPVEVISGDSFTYLGDYDLLDFDANGYVDIVLEGPRTVDVMLNDGNFGFTLYHTGIDFTPTGTFALSCHDIDGDADLDIVIDNQIFENHNGSWRKSIATMPPTTGLRFWGDLNSDGRIDFVHLDYSVLVPYVSKGDGIFEKKTEFGSARQDAPFFLADMDGDGDLDMFVSDTDYRYALYRNSFAQTGTVAFQKSHNFDFGGGAKVDFGDTNMDGLPDILVHGFLNNPQSTTFILENASTTSTIAFNVNNLDIPGTVSTALALVDFNNDGALDIHIGSSSSGSPVYGDHSIYLNEQAPITPAPSTPTGLQTLQNDAVILKWTAVPGKRYAIEIEKDNEILYPSGSLDDGTLMLPKGHLPFSSGQYILNNLPAGSYRWRAQTIDYASRASAFSAYQTFTIAGAPHTLSLTALDYRSVSLSWIYDGSTPDGFQIFRKSSSQAWMKAGEVPGSATSFNDNTLDENLWYEYFVKAVSGGASSAGSNSVYHFTGQFIEHEFGRNEPNIVPRTAAAADLDGDEDLDFQIVGWVDAKSQTGMKNDGAGNFSQTLFLPEGTYDNDYGALIHAGDMDSDGDIDICAYVGPSYNQKITVFTNVNGTYAKTFTSTDISSSFFQTIVKDFNNDGLMDIFYPSQVNNWSPYVYRLQYQQRDGTFTETSIKLDGSEISYRGYKVIDINLDGFLDIFFTGAGTPTKPALFAMNQSGEGFTLVETSVPSMYDLHFQDLNADGIIDLVFKHYDNRLVIQYGKGDNKYDEPIFLRAFYIGDEMRVETVDIDFNGWPELIVYDNNYLHIINNNGNGSFEVSSIEFGIQGGPGIILTDLEQDGDADMLRLGANQWQGTSTIYENQQSTPSRTNQPPSAPANVASTRAAGRTTITWNVATDDKTPSKLITYNVLIKDAGGKTWVHPGTNAAGTFRNVYQAGNAGANAFFVVTGLPAGSYTAQVQAVDATFALSAWSSPLALEVMQGADDLTVERLLLNKVKLSWTLPPSSDGVMVERKTTEGFKVIAELGAGVTEYIDDKLPYNQQFTYRVISTVNGVTAAPSNTATWNTGMWVVKDTSLPNAEKSVDVGDFTGDGKMDIVMTGFFADNQNHERVKASFESTGTGFTRQDFGNLTNPSLPVASLADLNHDGQLDIYEYGYSSTNGYMANIYQNNGNKTFSAYTNIITNSNAEILSYLDFDRDNDLDLYVGTIPSGGNPSTRLVRNTGTSYENTDIFFKACEYYSCSYQSISGDFDNDGDDDLIRSNVLYLNTPKGLSEAKVFNAGSGAYRKVDFNGDGWLDVIFIGYEYYTTSKLYENKGLDADGHLQFQETTVSLPGGSAELVEHAADFDHDGDTDLLFVGGAITVFNNDNGAFQPYTIDRFRSGGASEMIDYDQDGDLDVILTGGFSIDNSSITSVVAKVLENKIIDGGTGEINQAPAAPSNLRTLQDEQGIHLLWDAPTDDRTPSSGLTYDVVLYKGGQAMLKGMVDPNTGMRTKLTTGTSFGKLLLDLPSGNYEWKVQAVDPGFSGSAFSELHSFFALPPLPGMIDTTIYKCNRTVTLTAVGKNIKWYADVNKTTLLATGVYHPEASATVFVTQTDNGSESYPRKVVVTIYEKPNKPGTSEEIKICENVSTSVQ
ncbi:MAG TPA: FG-GAP-like repeat-containing protein, partial [Cyclobacteriaceae bacterium]|nr:FG-GAP-like repeat-containing protein [Cyclobacteriaceae bacterium]